MDLKRSSRIMFVVPNRIWASAINKYDIWGIDSSRDPPEYNALPTNPLPFEVVKVKGRIYVADKRGDFKVAKRKGKQKKPEQIEGIPLQLLEKKLYKIKPAEYWVKKFEKETGKKAIYQKRITKNYTEWLRNEYRLENVAEDLNYKDPHNKLWKIKEYYEQLDLPEKELKKVMFKVYNKIYKDQIHSYTKDYNEFYNRRFYNKVERDLNALKRKQREKMKDPLKQKRSQERFKTGGLRHYKLMQKLDKLQYVYSPLEVKAKMKYLKDDEIIADVLAQMQDPYGSDIGAGQVDWEQIEEQKRKEWGELEAHYSQKAYEDYLEQLELMATAKASS